MLKRGVYAAWLVIASGGLLFAQANATINGRVVDQAGAVLPGTTVTVTDSATGVTRDTVTNAEGLYSVPALNSGTYTIKAELAGFAPAVKSGVQLLTGATLTMELQLGLASIQESVTVSGAVPLVETTQSVVAGSITQAEVQTLPMLNRSMAAMMNLLPGAREVPGTTSAHGFSSSFVSFGGGAGRNYNMLVDGVDNKEDNCGGTFIVYSLEGVQEFKTLTNGASAEYGRGAATVLVATKSGTNQLHGTAFLYGRNQNLIKIDYFSDPANGGFGKPKFDREQYGGSLGGPVLRDKFWFFGSVERIAQNYELPRAPAAYSQIQYLVPLNINVLNSNTIPQPSRDLLQQYKINFQLGHAHSAWARWSSEYSYINNDSLGTTGALLAYDPVSDRNHQITWNIAGGETWVINPTTVNQVTVQYLSFTHDTHYPACPLPTTQLGVYLGADACLSQRLTFPSGVSTGPVGGGAFALFTDLDNKVEFKEDFSKQLGRHSLKVGASYMKLLLFGGVFGPASPGAIAFFDDPSTIVNNTNGRYPQGFQTPGIVRSIQETSLTIGDYSSANGSIEHCQQVVTIDCGTNDWGSPDWALGTYVQDDFRVSPRVTLNLGLRWDAYDYFGLRNLPNSRVYQVLKAVGNPFGASIPQQDWKMFGPREGIAWDLRGDGKDVVRGSYGLFYAPGIQNTYYIRNMLSQKTIYTQATFINSAIGVGPLANYIYGVTPLPAPPAAPTFFPPGNSTAGYWYNPDIKDQRYHQIHGGWSHVFPHETVVALDYTHILGHNGWRQLDINPLLPNPANPSGARVRPLAADTLRVYGDANLLGPVYTVASVNRSLYDEFVAHFERRFSQAAALQVNYVLAWARGMAGLTDSVAVSSNAAIGYPQTPSTIGGDIYAPYEWGPTPYDERHRVTVTGLFSLPFGIDVSPTFTAASARPYMQFRALNPSGDGSLMILDANGNPAGINNVRGIPLVNLNTRITKNLELPGSKKVQLFAELYNITNRANFGNQYFGNAFSPATYNKPSGYMGGVGAVSTLPNSFQMQFGGRVSF